MCRDVDSYYPVYVDDCPYAVRQIPVYIQEEHDAVEGLIVCVLIFQIAKEAHENGRPEDPQHELYGIRAWFNGALVETLDVILQQDRSREVNKRHTLVEERELDVLQQSSMAVRLSCTLKVGPSIPLPRKKLFFNITDALQERALVFDPNPLRFCCHEKVG